MKQLTCEMCGSTDLLKQDGAFVCQSCGTKYSIEEAKKMMVEGTVEVTGTVKVDSSDKISNFLMMAKNAYDANNLQEAENYCNKIIEIEPNHYEAWFIKGKAAGWQSTMAKNRIEESLNCFIKAVENAPEDKAKETKDNACKEFKNLAVAMVNLSCSHYEKSATESNAKTIKSLAVLVQIYALKLQTKCGVKKEDIDFTSDIAIKINNGVVAGLKDIERDYRGSNGDLHPNKNEWLQYKTRLYAAVDLLEYAISLEKDPTSKNNKVRYENIIYMMEKIEKSCSYHLDSNANWVPEYTNSQEAKNKMIDKIMECHNKIKEIDPNYVVPERPNPSKQGCYVATAVYGSYDCPQVWTLRRYRDYTLAKTWYGRAFIHTYYAVSPTLVKWFGNTEWFKKLWKGKLDRMVESLNAEGVENTPYADRNW